MECKKAKNLVYCNCTFKCNKKGICCDCVKHHREEGQLPGCYFPVDAEVTGNRTIENFIALVEERGKWWKKD